MRAPQSMTADNGNSSDRIVSDARRTVWTAAEDALAKEMCERGCTNAEIVACLAGRTVKSVESHISKLRKEGVVSRVYRCVQNALL
jgi:DNA-binding CsgD family transcriptional regulator